jgi:uncharacterized membrane protein
MKTLTIAKILDYISMLGILVMVFLYFFLKVKFPIMAIALLVICIVKMLGSMMRANFYQKDNQRLHDENENYKQAVDELKEELNKINNK